MTPEALGKLCALLNALTWACALIFFKRSGERIAPLALNLFKNSVGIVCLALTLALVPFIPPIAAGFGFETPGDSLGQTPPAWILDFRSNEMLILLLSGVLGIAIADTIFFYGLNLAGVGLIAIVDCAYTPFVMLFSAWWLGEELAAVHFVGAGLILAAVLLTTGHKPPPDRTRRQILLGIGLALTAVALMAFGIVFAKPVLEKAPALWTTQVRLVGGTVALALLAPLLPGPRAVWEAFRPSQTWRMTIPASFFGAYLAMTFWVAGFALIGASVNAALNQTSSIFALILAAIFLHERLTAWKAAALLLALAGVMLMVFDEPAQAGLEGIWNRVRSPA